MIQNNSNFTKFLYDSYKFFITQRFMRLPSFFLRKNGEKTFSEKNPVLCPNMKNKTKQKQHAGLYLCRDQGCSNCWEFVHFSRMIRKWRVLKLLQLFRTSVAGKHKNFKCLAKPALDATKKKKKKKNCCKKSHNAGIQ